MGGSITGGNLSDLPVFSWEPLRQIVKVSRIFVLKGTCQAGEALEMTRKMDTIVCL